MPAQRTPEDVANLIRGFLDGTDDRAWDDFESVPIADPFLEAFRQRTIPMGPPDADIVGLQGMLTELKAHFREVR
jgi:hypothetical protein